MKIFDRLFSVFDYFKWYNILGPFKVYKPRSLDTAPFSIENNYRCVGNLYIQQRLFRNKQKRAYIYFMDGDEVSVKYEVAKLVLHLKD